MKNEGFYGEAYWQYFWSNNAACPDAVFVHVGVWIGEWILSWVSNVLAASTNISPIINSIINIKSFHSQTSRQQHKSLLWRNLGAAWKKAERFRAFLSETCFKGSTLWKIIIVVTIFWAGILFMNAKLKGFFPVLSKVVLMMHLLWSSMEVCRPSIQHFNSRAVMISWLPQAVFL